MRMRQSLAELEQAFENQVVVERDRREWLRHEAARRSRSRRLERQHKHGSMRFGVLVLVLLATAVGVTIAMFETLYYLLG